MKSHSDTYSYRCGSCKYVSKYTHTLKTHLREKAHEPAPVINPDGTLNYDTDYLLSEKKSSSKSRQSKKIKNASATDAPASANPSPFG